MPNIKILALPMQKFKKFALPTEKFLKFDLPMQIGEKNKSNRRKK